MTSNAFGGLWTADKLDALRRYLSFYTTALAGQSFDLVYIDAFAGTGRCKIKVAGDESVVIDGSALIALNCAPSFKSLHFIESKRRHVLELQGLIDQHANGAKATLSKGQASDMLWPILHGYDWAKHRGVLFLDPFGLQCDWGMLEKIQATKALDVFFFVSLSGLYRQAAIDESDIDEGKAARLTAFLGTDEWRTRLYTNEQADLFNESQVTRAPGWADILRFTTERLRLLFPHVDDPVVMGRPKGAPLYALYFAVSNPSKPALALASRVGRDILKPLRR